MHSALHVRWHSIDVVQTFIQDQPKSYNQLHTCQRNFFLDSNEIKAMLPQSVHLSDMAMIYVEGDGEGNGDANAWW